MVNSCDKWVTGYNLLYTYEQIIIRNSDFDTADCSLLLTVCCFHFDLNYEHDSSFAILPDLSTDYRLILIPKLLYLGLMMTMRSLAVNQIEHHCLRFD